ncbi:MAG: DNA-directed RNA polymerase subunit L [Methanomicrobiales archaeon]|nr:DNA-directed RNA polymerase subunit L [Methanomicrobiales archaeon]
MEIKILELTKDRARIAFVGEGHTFMNLLTDEVLKDPAVDVARYTMEYQHSDPEFFITTKKKDPVKVLREACRRISGYCDEILEEIKGA